MADMKKDEELIMESDPEMDIEIEDREVALETDEESPKSSVFDEEDTVSIPEGIEDDTEVRKAAPESTNLKQQGADNEPRWYVVHTYSGHENKVKTNIEAAIKNNKLQEQMFEVMVPTQEVVETTKTGKRKTISRKLMPCYVLVNMIMNDRTWYVVRNTSGVTGFVGPGSMPVPLSDDEMRMFGVKKDDYTIDVAVGDEIRIISGVWEGNQTKIKKVNAGKQTVTVELDLFGRSTDVEISLGEIIKL